MAYHINLISVVLQTELIWPIWAPMLVIGALIYSLVVLDWLSHRVYQAVARKLLPAH